MNAFILLYFLNTELSREKKIMYFNNLEDAKKHFNTLKNNLTNLLVSKNIINKQMHFNYDTNYFINWQTDEMSSYQYCTFHIKIIEMPNRSGIDLTNFM